MTEFTPFSSLFGGALIGLAAVLLMLFHGRIAGISGIISGILPPWVNKDELGWRIAFVIGLVLAPVFYQTLRFAMLQLQGRAVSSLNRFRNCLGSW